MKTIYQFHGGDMDGRAIDSESTDEFDKGVLGYIEHIEVGSGMLCARMLTKQVAMDLNRVPQQPLPTMVAKGMGHIYKVANRADMGDHFVVTVEYSVRPPNDPRDSET